MSENHNGNSTDRSLSRRQILGTGLMFLSGVLTGVGTTRMHYRGKIRGDTHTRDEREWERFAGVPNLTEDRIKEFLETYKNDDHQKIAEEARKVQSNIAGKNPDLTIDALAKWYVACARQHETESQVDRGYVLSAGNLDLAPLFNHSRYNSVVDITPLFRVKVSGLESERIIRPYIMARDSRLEERGSLDLSAVPYQDGEGYSLLGTGVVAQGSNVGMFPNKRITDMKEIDAVLGEYKTGVPPAPMLLSEGKNPLQIILYNMNRG